MTCDEIIKKRKELWQQHKDIEKDTEFTNTVAEYFLNPENALLRSDVSAHPEKLIEMFFLIVDKDEETVPFFLNSVQKEFVKIFYETQKKFDDGTITSMSFLVLKGRQQGKPKT